MNELIQTVDEDGFVIIRDLFDPALVEQGRALRAAPKWGRP